MSATFGMQESSGTTEMKQGAQTAFARSLAWHGSLMTFLGLISGFTVLFAKAPRGALGAHTIGLLQGAMLLAIAGAWHLFEASPRMRQLIKYSLLIGFYANWVGAQLGGLWSAARQMYIPDHAERMPSGAAPWMDLTVGTLLIASMIVLVSSLLLLWAARGRSVG